MKLSVSLLLLFPLALAAADPVFESARQKLDLIENKRAQPGSVIIFTPAEINAYARVQIPGLVPEGLRNARAELLTGSGNGYALVNFLKMRHGQGLETNRLIAKLIEGERPLKVSLRVQSSGGWCTVYLTGVELSGVAITGSALDFLIKTFFLPIYPEAKIGQPFELGDNIERIDIRPTGVRVAIKK